MLGRLLSLFSLFDWYMPLLALIHEGRHGEVIGFYVPYSAGWSIRGIRHLLSGRGIKVIGTDLYGSLIRFSVPASQTRYARYLMDCEGIPYQSSHQADDYHGLSPDLQGVRESAGRESQSSDFSERTLSHNADEIGFTQSRVGDNLSDALGDVIAEALKPIGIHLLG